MSADTLLALLDKVKRTGPGKWHARCPAHEDRGPSLSIRELEDGRVLVNDFGGCSTPEILAAVGLTFTDLFPRLPPPVEGKRPERRPWIPSDAFEIARIEIMVASLIACDMHKGKSVSDEDYERLLVAAGRLNDIGSHAYGSR